MNLNGPSFNVAPQRFEVPPAFTAVAFDIPQLRDRRCFRRHVVTKRRTVLAAGSSLAARDCSEGACALGLCQRRFAILIMAVGFDALPSSAPAAGASHVSRHARRPARRDRGTSLKPFGLLSSRSCISAIMTTAVAGGVAVGHVLPQLRFSTSGLGISVFERCLIWAAISSCQRSVATCALLPESSRAPIRVRHRPHGASASVAVRRRARRALCSFFAAKPLGLFCIRTCPRQAGAVLPVRRHRLHLP